MSKHPNMLIVMADQWRRESLGFRQRDPVNTPHMDRFAQEGTVFERAYSCSPLCTPARAAFLTGRHPWGIDMMYNWQRVPVDEPCLGTSAAEQGYDTALIGKWHLDDHEPEDPHGDHWNCMTPPGPRRMGFNFWHSAGCVHNHFRLNYVDTKGGLIDKTGWQVDYETDVAIDYIQNTEAQRSDGKPWLMWLNWSPPHTGGPGPDHDPQDERHQDACKFFAPLEEEAPYATGELSNWHPDVDEAAYQRQAKGYFGCIGSMDRNFGRLMQCLSQQGIDDNTIVVLTADHGEMLGIHGRWTKDVWYEESIGIPLIVRWPGQIPAGEQSDLIVNTPDILPTLFGLSGLSIPAGRDGQDLSSFWRGAPEDGACEPDAAYLSFCTGAPPAHKTRYDFPVEKGMYWRGIRTKRYTYVCVDQRPESVFYDSERRDAFPPHATCVLFDNEEDPYQINPIYTGGNHDTIIAALHKKLSLWLASLGDPFLHDYWAPTRYIDEALI